MLLFLVVDPIKAFDTLNYEILLEKLRVFRFLDQSMQWFRPYLSGYTHFVIMHQNSVRCCACQMVEYQ